jgi:hypothetical protein
MDRRLSRVSAVLALAATALSGVVLPASAVAQQVYKWTDGNGQTHYSDHAPTGQTAATVDVPRAPQGGGVTPPNNPNPYHSSPGYSGTSNSDVEATRQRERSNAEMAAQNKRADDALIAKCKAQRDTDCNQIDAIKKREAILNERRSCTDSMDGSRRICTFTPAPPPPPVTRIERQPGGYSLPMTVLPPRPPPPVSKSSNAPKYTINDN